MPALVFDRPASSSQPLTIIERPRALPNWAEQVLAWHDLADGAAPLADAEPAAGWTKLVLPPTPWVVETLDWHGIAP